MDIAPKLKKITKTTMMKNNTWIQIPVHCQIGYGVVDRTEHLMESLWHSYKEAKERIEELSQGNNKKNYLIEIVEAPY